MQDKLWIVYDLAAIVFMFFMVSSGWKNGLVKTLINSLGGLAALVAALIISVPISNMIYEKVIESKIVDYVDQQLVGLPDFTEETQSLFEKIPENKLIEYIDNLLVDIKLPKVKANEQDNKLSSQLLESINNGNSISEAITEVFISPVALNIIRLIAGIILFILFSFIIKILSGLFGEIVGMIPIIGPINRLLGAAAGGAWALVILYVIVMMFNLLTGFFGDSALFNSGALNDTYFLSRLIF